MSETIETLSGLLGVDIAALSVAIVGALATIEFLKKLPFFQKRIGKIDTGYLLGIVIAGGTGGYFQYGIVSADALVTFMEWLSVVWAGVLAFIISGGWYQLAFRSRAK